MKRISPRGRQLVRSVARDSYIAAAGNVEAATMLFRHDKRLRGYSSIWLDLAIQIAILWFRHWWTNQISSPAAQRTKNEPDFDVDHLPKG